MSGEHSGETVRVWVDGCYDLFHFGHANAIRQARGLFAGPVAVVAGVCSDASIAANKGPTATPEAERYAAVAACRWVDEVAEDAPYETQLAAIDSYRCAWCVHGDDITTMADGSDCYSEAKAAGRYKQFKRTQGVSTTELVGRILKMSDVQGPPVSSVSTFVATASRIAQFSSAREPAPSDRIVYVHGQFDLFHIGHIEFLKAARSRGDFLVVGIHDDATTNHIMGSTFPVMNLHERVLSVLQCRYVDDVIIGAPYKISDHVLTKAYKVDVVCHLRDAPSPLDVNGLDPYQIPKERGIFQEIDAPNSTMTTQTIISRILGQRQVYEARNARKLQKGVIEQELLKKESIRERK
ncbi:hypothetical protein HK100_012869 [Physocladia obscura]|uniref:ethanolamine-phosphate cytidylyltransferase n=1 Tax=Physocladia obscura TaxID=109957 RepID=A0AAD5SZ53_9FUNG|nr:hypothetical protein HK100_012869 [Physocladia obscura]